MNRPTHTERIIALLAISPGLDDDEIARKLAITPRQTVNQICRRLLEGNAITREPGPRGKVVNRLTTVVLAPTPRNVSRDTVGGRSHHSGTVESFQPADLARTLIVIPCSKSKQSTGAIGERGTRIADSLPGSLARELEQARARVRGAAAIDETTLIPAWNRYSGSLYEHGREAISDLLGAGAHIAIVSGGYGVVLATEPIGTYEAPLKLSSWPQRLIARVLLAYVEANALKSVRAFAPASSNYRKALTGIVWNAAGVEDALLLIPDAVPGGTRKSPASIGDALAALRDGLLSAEWRSVYALALGVA